MSLVPVTDLIVANMALGHINSANISGFNDGSTQGYYVGLYYYTLRDTFIQEAQWTFARNSQVLTSITYPDNNYLYAYLYPSDCLRIDQLRMPELLGQTQNNPSIPGTFISNQGTWRWSDDIPHEIAPILNSAGQTTGQFALLCNMDSVIMVYTRQMPDPNTWPSAFLYAFSLKLALVLSGPLNTSDSIIKKVEMMYEKACPIAKRIAANEAVNNGRNISNIEANRKGGRRDGREGGSYAY